MSKRFTTVGLVVLFAVLGFIVASVGLKTFLASVIGGLVGGVIGFAAALLVSSSRKETVPVVPPQVDDTLDIMQELVRTNLKARVEGIQGEALDMIERIISRLRVLVPEFSYNYPSSPLTWEVKQSAKDYLPRIIAPYTSLSPVQREESREKFLQSLSGLEDAVNRAETAARERKADEFSVVADFMKARFGNQF